MEDIERSTSKITQEMLEKGEARDGCLTELLVQMESQARSKLEEKRKIINQLEEEWARKVAEDKEAWREDWLCDKQEEREGGGERTKRPCIQRENGKEM